MYISKCLECGNTLKTNQAKEGETVTCQSCEANYKIQIKDGKVKLTEFIYEKEDFGELLDS